VRRCLRDLAASVLSIAESWKRIGRWRARSAARLWSLVEQQVLREPLLYLSLYLKTHRADYYRLLQEVRPCGTWEAWLEFFLTGVAATANNAHDSALRIVTLFSEDRARITAVGEQANSMLRLTGMRGKHTAQQQWPPAMK
jgi:Fic family protein